MLIESKIRRDGGSRVDIAGVEYHFAPTADGAHVCEVADEAAIERLLSIPEGFCMAATAQPMVLKNEDGSTVDLSAMNKKQLMAFGKEAGFSFNPMESADAIRAAILAQAKG